MSPFFDNDCDFHRFLTYFFNQKQLFKPAFLKKMYPYSENDCDFQRFFVIWGVHTFGKGGSQGGSQGVHEKGGSQGGSQKGGFT